MSIARTVWTAALTAGLCLTAIIGAARADQLEDQQSMGQFEIQMATSGDRPDAPDSKTAAPDEDTGSTKAARTESVNTALQPKSPR